MYTSDYPQLESTTYTFTTRYNTTIRFTACDGNFDNVRAWINGAPNGFTVHDDDDIEFWQAVVFYYLETDGDSPGYSNEDLFRAAQACLLLEQIPEWSVLNDLIGYDSRHGYPCAHYDDMFKAVEAYKETNND